MNEPMIGNLFLTAAGAGLLLGLLGGLPGKLGTVFTLICATAMAVCLIGAGILIFQLPPWDPVDTSEVSDPSGWRQMIAIQALKIGAVLGPQGAGAAVAAIGAMLLYPLARTTLFRRPKKEGA